MLTHVKWQLFQLLERLTAKGEKQAPAQLPDVKPALWIFVSTVGELNAIGPLIHHLTARLPALHLVLLTDRKIYRHAYLAQYPEADVVEIGVDNATAAVLAAARPPRLFVVAEIPCLPADAPCRLPFGYLWHAHTCGAKLAVVNGWLYGYAPSCRIDKIERALLTSSYLRLFDVLCVQTDDIAHQLVAAGAIPNSVHVTGNIKFDALHPSNPPGRQVQSPVALASIEKCRRTVVVAGCVTSDDERELVLDAFLEIQTRRPDALLVLAPRHPENQEVMRSIAASLQARALSYRSHRDSGDQPVAQQTKVLILDTIGELRDFYAHASVAHVGRDHNILEPLAFSKPITVLGDWSKTYPSFPVLQLCIEHQLVAVCDTATDLHTTWLQSLSAGDTQSGAGLISAQGATERCLRAIESAFGSRA
ncbi:hypothetical protein OPU71_12080 [Niveibacterium sp. 24ML]|uniref:3-deoxy-D-manno-octulosonic acid transferase n=1 Tax=Niveibacterium sp. 24ML TaxID=2985512 RepID=UPI0022708529|nr:glycosyltransferase N-terminal domain-containing protein [Niveibacterium sp. 24ML]MCX9156863.1 hypothetical protein [Niveibacterium sp. 24ML]